MISVCMFSAIHLFAVGSEFATSYKWHELKTSGNSCVLISSYTIFTHLYCFLWPFWWKKNWTVSWQKALLNIYNCYNTLHQGGGKMTTVSFFVDVLIPTQNNRILNKIILFPYTSKNLILKFPRILHLIIR